MLERLRATLARLIAPKRAPSTRMYAGARASRLAGGAGSNSSADMELVTSLTTLRTRARQLVRDASYAKRAKVVVVNNVIGAGIGLQAQVKTTRGDLNTPVNDAIEEAFQEWSRAETCHTGGTLHFNDFERAMFGQIFEAGEVFVRKHYRAFGGSKVPFALELIEAERIADNVQPGPAEPGNMVRMGIEVDPFYRPVAYWIRERHQGEFQFLLGVARADRYERVAASEIYHLRIADRWPQTRGEPWLHSVIRRLQDMDGYSEAEIVAARGAASYMAAIETPDDNSPLVEKKEDGSREITIEPGITLRLAPGEKFNFVSPNRPNPNMDPFMRMMLREVAAGTGPSYESLSRDYSQSNYSSSRLALLDDRDLWRFFQRWFMRSFREPLHEEWLQQAVLARAIPQIGLEAYAVDQERYGEVRFKPRGWSWIDPTKEVDAFAKAVRSGFTTVADVISQTSDRDVEDLLGDRRQELDDMKEKNLEFDTDPARMADGKIAAQVGSALAAQQAGPDAGAGGTTGQTPSDPGKNTARTIEAVGVAVGTAVAEVIRHQKPPQALVNVAAPVVNLAPVTVKGGDVRIEPQQITVKPADVRVEVQPAAAPAVTVENKVEPTPIQIENRIDVPAPKVTVEAPHVTVEPAQVHVAAPEVRIENKIEVDVPAETETVTSFERDEKDELVRSRSRTVRKAS